MTVSKTLLLFALVAATGLSGCFGAGNTLQATMTYTAYDPDTGAVLVDDATGAPIAGVSITFHPGSGDSGFGTEFERQVMAAGVNQTVNVTTRADYVEQVGRERVFPSSSALVEVGYAEFVGALGEPTVGQTFDYSQLYPARVEVVNEPITEDAVVTETDPDTGETTERTETRVVQPGTVTFRVIPEPGQRDPVPAVGAVLITLVEGDQITQMLEPTVGAKFPIMASPQGTPLGLAPGQYRTVGANETAILYEFSPHPSAMLLGRDVLIQATLTSVTSAALGEAPPASGANFGARTSPQLNAPAVGPADAGHDHGDDGHGGHDH